jgi:hypothetical protein
MCYGGSSDVPVDMATTPDSPKEVLKAPPCIVLKNNSAGAVDCTSYVRTAAPIQISYAKTPYLSIAERYLQDRLGLSPQSRQRCSQYW